MDLIALKQYLRSRKLTPLQDAAHHFKVDTETIRPLFDFWYRKGKLRKCVDTQGICQGCCKCDPASIEIFEWID